MPDINKLKSINWHDGMLLTTKITTGKKQTNFILTAELYSEPINSDKRDKFKIKFINIDRLTISLNTEQLKESHFAGNINHANINNDVYSDDKKHTLYLILFGGLIMFDFASVKIESKN